MMFYNKLINLVSDFYHWMIQFQVEHDSEEEEELYDDGNNIYKLII